MMWVMPNIIMPMFNKYEELKDKVLHKRIEKLCEALSYPMYALFQVDGSKRSSHSNAYLFGFWKYKRIVLYDTLLHLSHEEILSILGHELGHWKMGHTLTGLVITSVHTFVLFWTYGMVLYSEHAAGIYKSFGYEGAEWSVLIGLVLYSQIIEPINEVIQRLWSV